MMNQPPLPSRDAAPALSVRERLIACAVQLFYIEGIRAISADRLIAEVGTTKATFYRHFPTKDDLVLAYLQRRAAQERSSMTAAAAPTEARHALNSVIAALADSSCSPGFRGCPFINAAAEYPDPAHPVRQMINEHRTWWKEFFAELALRNGTSPERVEVIASQLLMLRDGTTLAGYIDSPTQLKAVLTQAVDTLMA